MAGGTASCLYSSKMVIWSLLIQTAVLRWEEDDDDGGDDDGDVEEQTAGKSGEKQKEDEQKRAEKKEEQRWGGKMLLSVCVILRLSHMHAQGCTVAAWAGMVGISCWPAERAQTNKKRAQNQQWLQVLRSDVIKLVTTGKQKVYVQLV